MRNRYRHTKIIFTVGPATRDVDTLTQLIEHGVAVMRLNMAHANEEWTRETIANLKEASKRTNRQIATMMDVKGPEIRTGDVEKTHHLEVGQHIFFYTDREAMESRDETDTLAVTVNYSGLPDDVVVGRTLLVDSGLIRMSILETWENRILCRVETPGPLGNRRHVNLPGIKVNLPCLTRKDINDVKLGIDLGIDFFALSFVREADDLDILRRFLSDHRSSAQVIAKIEDQSGISNLAEIVRACDGLMVARGDLGIEVPYEDLPVIQRNAVQICREFGKPVIIATHMLESMIESPMPTRAEITDVANAVFEQADCTMLSGETTVGKYPVECVDVLTRIMFRVEAEETKPLSESIRLKTPKFKMLRAAATFAQDLTNSSILVYTRGGHLPRLLAGLRPVGCPIFAFSDIPSVHRQMCPLWGVEPILMEFAEDMEETILSSIELLKDKGWCKRGDHLVLVTNHAIGERHIDAIQYRAVE